MTAADIDLALDDPELLERRDEGRLLWSLAGAGAGVRRVAGTAADFGVDRLRGEVPRAVLVATDGPAVGVARALVRLAAPMAPALKWGGVELPRWAGPADALLVAAVDGRHPRVAGLVEQGNRRGMSVAVVTQEGSPVADAAGRSPVAALPRELNQRAARWPLLAPMLLALDSLGLLPVPVPMLDEIADALDSTAEACRLTGDAFTNPAKALAAEFAETLPVIAGAGPLAGIAAREFADALELFAGCPAEATSLPDNVARAGALLAQESSAGRDPGDPDDFFRDRSADPAGRARRPRLVVIGDDGDADDPSLGPRSGAQIQLDEVAARRAAKALLEIAAAHGVRSSHVEVPALGGLARMAAATAFGDFTAAYLALGSGLDPSAPRPGELAH